MCVFVCEELPQCLTCTALLIYTGLPVISQRIAITFLMFSKYLPSNLQLFRESLRKALDAGSHIPICLMMSKSETQSSFTFKRFLSLRELESYKPYNYKNQKLIVSKLQLYHNTF